jgi:acetylornithine deacetylase/succinyl-diaminopimelate desuccinylase-like protein
VRTALQSHTSQFDEQATLGVWQFSTNGVATKGMYGIPTIGYGPGREEHAHTRDDQVRVDDLVKAAEFYAAFVLNQIATEPRANGGFGPTGTR